MELHSHSMKILRLASPAKLRYNGAIFTFNKQNYIIYRAQNSLAKHSWLEIAQIDDNHNVSNVKQLYFGPYLTIEDPRVLVVKDNIYVFANSGITNNMIGWKSLDSTIMVIRYNSNFEWQETNFMDYPDSNEIEKNWTFFYEEGKFYCLYSMNPWIILQCDKQWKCKKVYEHDYNLQWDYGTMRGGTTPLLLFPPTNTVGFNDIDFKYFVFFHSRWDYPVRKYNKPPQYVAGCVSTEDIFPFKPTAISRFPLLKPLIRSVVDAKVVFPCGCIKNNDKLIISSGSGDCQLRIDTFDKIDVEHNMKRI